MKWRRLALFATLGWCAFNAQARELIACGHPYYPPVSWVHQHQLVGIAPTVIKQLFGELGYQVKLDGSGNWKRCLSEVSTGQADIIVAAYRIKSRERFLDYSQQYIVADPIGIFINTEQLNNYQTLDDLKQKTAGLLLGDSFGDSFDQFLSQHSRVEYVSNGRQNFSKLIFGRIDFMPLGLISGTLQSKKFGYSQQIVPAPLAITTEYYYLALSNHSKLRQHLPYINRRLAELHRDGTIKELQHKYSDIYLNAASTVDQSNEQQ